MTIRILEKETIRQQLYPLSVQAYHTLSENGIIPEKTELLEGAVIKKMSKNPIHSGMVSKITNFFKNHLPQKYYIRKGDPISFLGSEPEPDIAIVDYIEDEYMFFHPSTAYLIIEVANTSIELDREKASIYAKGGITEYWIINLNNQTTEVYKNPYNGYYTESVIIPKNDILLPAFFPELKFQLGSFY
ncbi:MAG: Uma2 family endonuclease [Leptospiraceae bacterium]|nr:Uma2 family endonuclease [Leptospiraceae bacterium]